ncbi:hypothetical protein Peur_004752 [Populus x canadensis]
MLSFTLKISPPDGALQLQSSRLQPLSSLPTYVAIYRKQSESLLSSIQLKRSHKESVQKGFRINLIFYGTVLVSSPSTQASEVSDSSYFSLSHTLRDNSGAGLVSPSSCLDGSGIAFFEGAEFNSGCSSTSTDDINWVFDLLAGVHGPGTSKSFALGLWSDMFPGTVDSNFELHLWVFLTMQGDKLLLLGCHVYTLLAWSSASCIGSLCSILVSSLSVCLPTAVCIYNDVRFLEKMELWRAAVFQLCEHYVGLLLLCLCTAVGVNLDMSGVLLGEGLFCLLVGNCLGEALSPYGSGLPLLLWNGFVAVVVSLLEMLTDDFYCGWRLILLVEAASDEALSPNAWPSPYSPFELLVLAGWSGLPSW